MKIDNIEFNDASIIKTFNNSVELSNWWSANPRAVRIRPEIKAKTLEEYNQKNHAIVFPCEMEFVFPVLNN